MKGRVIRHKISLGIPTKPKQPASHSLTKPKKLSPEILDIVVDFLRNDVKSLKSCSLTCHSLLASSRSRLFRVVHLHVKNCQKFLRILETSPGIGPYVRELHITATQRESPPWIDKYLPAIAEKLPYVLVLHIKGDATYSATPLLDFKSVRDLHVFNCDLESVNTMFTLFSSWPDLRTFDTHNMRVFRNDADVSPEPTVQKSERTPVMKSIILDCSSGDADKFVDWLIRNSFHLSLEYLSICPLKDIGLVSFGKLMKASAESLRYLKIALVGMKTHGGFIGTFLPAVLWDQY
jgi:hypothetical protein